MEERDAAIAVLEEGLKLLVEQRAKLEIDRQQLATDTKWQQEATAAREKGLAEREANLPSREKATTKVLEERDALAEVARKVTSLERELE